jgi:protein tyrosine phosphatase (PTP) superfamily phosphohydrolase (DUF442 family)
VPVRFDCNTCGSAWWAPPANGCPRCGYDATATPDPIIWRTGRVPGTNIFISGQMRDPERFAQFVSEGFRTFVDVAGDAAYIWRPDEATIRAAGVAYTRIPLEDTNVELPAPAFTAVREALDGATGDTLLFCAAGLKRAPHLLYGVLRGRGHRPDRAWALVSAARPMTDQFAPYIGDAERWARVQRDSLPSPL